jgi:hypothetical protein
LRTQAGDTPYKLSQKEGPVFSYDVKFDVLREIVAGVFLAGFVGIWAWIAIKVFRFEPTTETPQLVLSASFAAVSGALSGTVAAGTAAVLGIEVQREKGGQKTRNEAPSTRAAVAAAATASPLIIAGVCAYFFVGVLLIIAWLVKGDAAPDAVQSFALGSIGWMGGAFVAVFATDD